MLNNDRERITALLEELRAYTTQYRNLGTRMTLLTQHRQKVQYALQATSQQINQILNTLSLKERKGLEAEFDNLKKALSEGLVVSYHYQY